MYKEIKSVTIDNLELGMVLAASIVDHEGNVLLEQGIKLREAYIAKIHELGLEAVQVETWTTSLPHTDVRPQVDRDELIKKHIINQTRREATEIFEQAMDELVEQGALNAELIRAIVRKIVDAILSSDDIVFQISRLKGVDNYLFEHSINVTILSVITGIMMGYGKEQLRILGLGAMLHDVGKLFVNQDILNKPEKLSDKEFSIVKHHCKLGYHLLKDNKDVGEEVALIALLHHEQYDGSGYPESKVGETIPVNARIVGISDVFDALTSDRVYSKKSSPYMATEYLVKMSGKHFDGDLVKRFIAAIGYYFEGCLVKLNNGEIAKVVSCDRFRPVVRVMVDKNGMATTGHFEIDLFKNPSVKIREVLTKAQMPQHVSHGVQNIS